jgi:outer membrane protease
MGENVRKYEFSLGTGFGFVYGQSFELVYPTGNTVGELLSELIWEMKPVYYLGFHADFGRTDLMSRFGVFSSVDFKVGIRGDSGTHENRDWMSIENDNLTHFSSHTNKTHDMFWFDGSVGLSIPVKPFFYIKPFLNGSWMFFSFSGRDGYGIYARKTTCSPDCTLSGCVRPPCVFNPNDYTSYDPIKNNPHFLSYDGYGTLITYKQDWFILAAGLSIGTNIFYPLTFEFSFKISPLTYCVAVDQHLTRSITFYDFSSGGIFIEPSVGIFYSIHKLDISFDFIYRFIGKTRGPSYLERNNSGFYSPNNYAGASLSLINCRLLFNIRI